MFDSEPEDAKSKKKDKCIIHIVCDKELDNKIEDIEKFFDLMQKSENITWFGQFKEACLLHPQLDEEGNIEDVTGLEAFLHFVSIGWKVLFALIPPSRICRGWISFFISLIFIGLIVAIIAEFATLFGCVIGLSPAVTAFTFVALGTSLPDTFASRHAAMESKTADSAIVNITGSNSVNVFLGLGLPWIIASIYYESKGQEYRVPTGTLPFSVMLYLGVAVVFFIFLMVKRYLTGGELGGPNRAWRWGSFLFLLLLWMTYVFFSILKAYKEI